MGGLRNGATVKLAELSRLEKVYTQENFIASDTSQTMAVARAVFGLGERAERRVGACTKEENKQETEKGEKNGALEAKGWI